MRGALHRVLAGDLAAAERILADAARSDPDGIEVYLALADLYRSRGDIGRAIQIHQNLLLREDLGESQRREALLGLAMDFRTGGFVRRAAASFEALLAVDPAHGGALAELERLRVEEGDWEAAIAVRRRIGRRDPDTPRVLAHLWTGLGRQHAEADRESEARRAFRRALGHDRRCAEAYIALGDQRMREVKPARAIGHWKRALPLHPEIGRVLWSRLAAAFEQANDMAGFEKLLRERLVERPADPELCVWLARALCALQRADEAIGALRSVLDKNAADLGAHAELGRLLLREHRDADALEALARLVDAIADEPRRLQCSGCGTLSAELHWRCPQCGTWDGFG